MEATREGYGKDTVLLYADAAEESSKWGLGGALILPDGSRRAWGHELCELSRFSFGIRRRYIAALEAVALFSSFVMWSEYMTSRRTLLFPDNAATMGAYVKGFSKRCDVCRSVKEFWACAMRWECNVQLCYVPSKLNPADGPSRGLRSGLRATWETDECVERAVSLACSAIRSE